MASVPRAQAALRGSDSGTEAAHLRLVHTLMEAEKLHRSQKPRRRFVYFRVVGDENKRCTQPPTAEQSGLKSRVDGGEAEDEIPESGAVFTFGKSKFSDNIPSKFWLKNDVPLKISCGDEHTALITENKKLFMFGSNNWGQLGLGSKLTVNKPTCVKALKSEKVHLVACGRNHTLVCTAQGKVLASGGNSEGQLGLGDCEERTSFQRLDFFDSLGPIKMLAAGSNTSAALTASGKLFMWGDNTEGQIGLGKESQASSPQEVSVGRAVRWVSCGYYHSALVTVDGALYTFGERDSGKLGLGTEQLPGHRVPQRVKSIKEPVTQVACGGGHTVALTEDDVYTFGLGQFGQLGHGTFIFESRLPRPIEHFKKGRACQVTCGENHTAVITDGGLLYTFGDGRHGKLGLGEENFTNQFKPTLCPRFLKYNVQAASCGGCHMVVLARPRDGGCGDVTLEEDDVIEDYVEKPYVELLGDTADASTLQRSLSARVRRRERERSPDQFGAMFRTLPAMTPGRLHPPLPVSSHTIPPRLPPPELSHRKVLNGTHQHGSAGSIHQEQAGGETDSVVESMSDSDSVRGLGETTDFLNMTHVMRMDPSDKTLTLSPVQKRKGEDGKAINKQSQRKESSLSSTSPSGKSQTASSRRALPTELLRSHSAQSLASQSPQRLKESSLDKENLIMAVEELQRRPAKNKPLSLEDVRKAASQRRPRPGQGQSQLIGLGREPATEAEQSEARKTVLSISSGAAVGKVQQVESEPVRRRRKAIVVQSQHAGVRAADKHSPTSLHLREDLDQESTRGTNRKPQATEDTDLSKKSKNEKNRKEAQSKSQSERSQKKWSEVSLLSGAASVAAGSLLIQEVAARTESSRPGGRDSGSSFRDQPPVTINITPAPERPELRTSLDHSQEDEEEEEEDEEEEEEDDDEEEEEEDEEEEEEDEEEEVGHGAEKVAEDEEEEDEDKDSDTLHPKDQSETDEDEEDEEEEEEEEEEDEDEEDEEEVGHRVEKVAEDEEEEEEDEDKDSDTLHPEDQSETDEDEEEEEDRTSGVKGGEDECEEKESKGGDVEGEEEEESEEGLSHDTESKGGETEEEEEEGSVERESEEEEGGSETVESSEEREESGVKSEEEEEEE
ncbi:X-linked retinitis pigmentosa GTPase regulator-like, partial [Mugil cephalus]|uniref:X-linked retinitis pigmentosa GTPase regulator-like n=1 Tax=Mugil cephalus TaxID=48193 RepID=UPI001FB6B5BD